MSYNSVFGGTTIYPSQLTYFAFDLNTSNVVLEWTLDRNAPQYPAANIIDVNCTVGGLYIYLPAANLASTGQAILFNNIGTFPFTVVDFSGNTITSVSSGKLWQVYVADNTTANGIWQILQYGVGTSSASAGSLAGYGIKAIATTLNQSTPVVQFNSNYTTGNNDRSSLLLWSGGVGTLTLPLPATMGNDWFIIVRNQGTGTLTVDPTGSYLIDGIATKDIAPQNSCFVICDGTQYFTVGYGQNVNFAFNYISIAVGGSGNYTLSTAEQNLIAYKFTGALTGNRTIIVPPTIQQYWVDNATTNSYTFTVKTAAGSGFTVPQGSREILYCDGINVVNAATAGISFPIPVNQGGTGATTAAGALVNLGGGTTGISVFYSSSQAQARTAIGGTTIGQALYTTLASIAQLSNPTAGSGYVNGSYTNVPLTGGSGTGALANITVSGTGVSSVVLIDPGLGYELSDLLSASNSNLGGTGSGFTVTVTEISATEALTTLGGTDIGQALFTTQASIGSLTSVSAGTGYVNGTYTNVPLTGGAGNGALATIVISGTTVSSITLTDPGLGYSLNDLLSASNSNLGGTGTGFSVTVTEIAATEALTTLGGTDIGQALFTTQASIGALTSVSAGTGYVNGTYTNVPLTGGYGSGALAKIVVTGTSVSSITLTDPGLGYSLNNLLSASNTNLGGTGSGFQVKVTYLDAIEARAVLDVYSTGEVDAIASKDSYIAAVSLG